MNVLEVVRSKTTNTSTNKKGIKTWEELTMTK